MMLHKGVCHMTIQQPGAGHSSHQWDPGQAPFANQADAFALTTRDLARWQTRFGVAPDQIRHDYVISRVLEAIAPCADAFVFVGSTALSRTLLDGLRLSEGINLVSILDRGLTARLLDDALAVGLRDRFGEVSGQPRLTEVGSQETCVYHIGETKVRIQLISSDNCPPWPRRTSRITQRYSGLPDLHLTTYTLDAMVAAATSAWCDRAEPGDLYDLWALSDLGLIDAASVGTFKEYGPTGSHPRRWRLPPNPPTESAWKGALGHLCTLRVTADQAYKAVVEAWRMAVEATGEMF